MESMTELSKVCRFLKRKALSRCQRSLKSVKLWSHRVLSAIYIYLVSAFSERSPDTIDIHSELSLLKFQPEASKKCSWVRGDENSIGEVICIVMKNVLRLKATVNDLRHQCISKKIARKRYFLLVSNDIDTYFNSTTGSNTIHTSYLSHWPSMKGNTKVNIEKLRLAYHFLSPKCRSLDLIFVAWSVAVSTARTLIKNPAREDPAVNFASVWNVRRYGTISAWNTVLMLRLPNHMFDFLTDI